MKQYIPLIFIVGLAWGCNPPPDNFSNVPEISVERVRFIPGEGSEFGTFDTLFIRVSFRDGDGDLGLAPDETAPPFNNFFFYDTLSQRFVSSEAIKNEPAIAENLLTFKDRFSPRYDTLPDFSCKFYTFFTQIGQTEINDTLYSRINEDYYNFLADIEVKENGIFETYDFLDRLCQPTPTYGRFINLKEMNEFDNGRPLEGFINYRGPSAAYLQLFRNDTLRLRVRIKDRSGNTSKEDVSQEFTLDDITPN